MQFLALSLIVTIPNIIKHSLRFHQRLCLSKVLGAFRLNKTQKPRTFLKQKMYLERKLPILSDFQSTSERGMCGGGGGRLYTHNEPIQDGFVLCNHLSNWALCRTICFSVFWSARDIRRVCLLYFYNQVNCSQQRENEESFKIQETEWKQSYVLRSDRDISKHVISVSKILRHFNNVFECLVLIYSEW